MRNYIQSIFIVAAFAACNNKPSSPLQTDMVVLAPGNKIHVYTDAQSDTGEAVKFEAPLSKIDNGKPVPVTLKSRIRNIFEPSGKQEIPVEVTANNNEAGLTPTTTAPPGETGTQESTNTANTNTNTDNMDKQDTAIVAVKPVTVKEEKKGWSNATKGAVIGGVGGAIGGAIISRKKARGAVIGGIMGAAGGYIFGKAKDDKQAADSIKFAQYR